MPVTQTFTTLADLEAYILDRVTVNNNKEIDGQEMLNILMGIKNFISPKLQQQLVVQVGAGQSVGGSDTGETFAIGTTLEAVIRDILIKAIHPSYVPPTIQLTSNTNQIAYEIGSVISPILNLTFTQNDGGAILTRALKKNTVQIASSFPYVDNNIALTETPTAYQGTLTYAQGPVKNNNLGVPDAIGQIPGATSVSNIITYFGYRNMFYGCPPGGGIPVSSAAVRGLSDLKLNPVIGDEITIDIPLGATSVVFAYPSYLPDPSSVKYAELNLEVKDVFTKISANVQGANGYATAPYKVFGFEPVQPFPSAATYIVKI